MNDRFQLSWVIGLGTVLILIIGSQPSVQLALGKYLGLTPELTSRSQITPTGFEKGYVDRSVDGDTIVLRDGRTIRYLNIDTPESVKPNVKPQCYSHEASSRNQDLIEKKDVWLKADQENTDKYGRDLRFVWLVGRDTNDISQSVNAYLVENGFARSLGIKPNTTYLSQFQGLEKQAKDNKIGLWGSCPKPFEE